MGAGREENGRDASHRRRSTCSALIIHHHSTHAPSLSAELCYNAYLSI